MNTGTRGFHPADQHSLQGADFVRWGLEGADAGHFAQAFRAPVRSLPPDRGIVLLLITEEGSGSKPGGAQR